MDAPTTRHAGEYIENMAARKGALERGSLVFRVAPPPAGRRRPSPHGSLPNADWAACVIAARIRRALADTLKRLLRYMEAAALPAMLS